MRFALCLVFLILMGCPSQTEDSPKNNTPNKGAVNEFGEPETKGSDDNSPTLPSDLPKEDPANPAYVVSLFLENLKQGNNAKCLEFLTEDSKKIFTTEKLPGLKGKYYVLDVIKSEGRTVVQSLFLVLYQNKTYRKVRVGWLVQDQGGTWKIYGIIHENYTCLYPSHNAAKYENTAIAVMRDLRQREYLFRLKYGKLATIEEMVKEKFLPPEFKDGTFKGYKYIADPVENRVSIVAVPLVLLPTHRGFYIDDTKILRYSTDGSLPNGSCPPVMR